MKGLKQVSCVGRAGGRSGTASNRLRVSGIYGDVTDPPPETANTGCTSWRPAKEIPMNMEPATFTVLCAAATTLALGGEVPSVTIEIHHPTDTAHAEHVYGQIRNAAREVCAPLDSRELARRRLYNECVNQAVARAVAQVRSNALTEVHLSRVGLEQPRL
jgi:UrcA family protein